MRIVVLIITTWMLAFGGFAQEDSLFDAGNKAYAAQDFEGAINAYNKILATEKKSAVLYYNLGNAYYKQDELGEAIWAYEKALEINPSDENIRFNLSFVNAKTYDQLDFSETGIKKWLGINLFSYSINFWAYTSIFFAVLFSIVLYIFFTTKKQRIKNMSLTGGFAFSFLLILTVVLAYFNKMEIIDRDEAVIITETVVIRTSPSATGEEAFKLHEGTKINLLRTNENWVEVNINDNTGWVEKEFLWEI